MDYFGQNLTPLYSATIAYYVYIALLPVYIL